MEDDAHQLDELTSHLRVTKTYLKAKYRLSDLLRAHRYDHITNKLKRWIENGAPDKGDLEEDSYTILRQNYMRKEGRLYLNKGWDRCLQKTRGRQDPIQIQRDSVGATLSNRTFIQVT